MKQTQIKEWRDLEHYGINMLTAEADGVGMRLLCDVSERGVNLLSDYYGVAGMTLFPPMNSGDSIDGAKPVGSLFIARDAFQDLAAFCILQDWDVAVVVPYQKGEWWTAAEHVMGYTREEFEVFRQKEQLYQWHAHMKDGNARGGFRNQHFWTGRIE